MAPAVRTRSSASSSHRGSDPRGRTVRSPPASPSPCRSGDEVAFAYASGCGGGTDLWLDVAAMGLAPGDLDVGWTLDVDGHDPVEGEDVWTLGCAGDGGLEPHSLSIGLPVSADGAVVTLDVVLIDALGQEASVSHAFVAQVTEG